MMTWAMPKRVRVSTEIKASCNWARRSPTIYRLRAKSLMHESIGQTEKLVTSVSRETLYQPLRAK
ncbi:hypothetical protein DDW09_04505 [Sulfolobus sp. SCGC AB-777_L09]|jgi:hypothetical protein|nr:hypothetical protein DDW09_04505 [Sulfolobus sp. SCGC AB-777_L09]